MCLKEKLYDRTDKSGFKYFPILLELDADFHHAQAHEGDRLVLVVGIAPVLGPIGLDLLDYGHWLDLCHPEGTGTMTVKAQFTKKHQGTEIYFEVYDDNGDVESLLKKINAIFDQDSTPANEPVTEEVLPYEFDPNPAYDLYDEVAAWVIRNHWENCTAGRLHQTFLEFNIPTKSGKYWTVKNVQTFITRFLKPAIPDVRKPYTLLKDL